MFALVPSPFLGRFSWEAVRTCLDELERPASVIHLSSALEVDHDFYRSAAMVAVDQITGPTILVAHSGAGGLVPAIAAAAASNIRAAVFVDALLPHPGRSWFDTAPRDLVDRIRNGARNGHARPWPTWVGREILAQLLPDPVMRRELEDRAPAAPLAYLEEPAPVGSAWPPVFGCGYLQLSAAYDAEAAQARTLGWPAHRLQGHHLSIMTEPKRVATALVALAIALKQSP